jgi:hypothetical protein
VRKKHNKPVDVGMGFRLIKPIRIEDLRTRSIVQQGMSARKAKKTTTFVLKQLTPEVPLLTPACGMIGLPEGRFVFPASIENPEDFIQGLAKRISESAQIVERLTERSAV